MRNQITTALRLVISLLGSLMILDADLVAFLSPLLEQAVGVVFELIAIIGLVTDRIKQGGAAVKSVANPFLRALLLAD